MVKLVSVARSAAQSDADEQRFEMLAADPELQVTRVVPWTDEAPPERPGTALHTLREPVRLRGVPRWGQRLQIYPRLAQLFTQLQPEIIHVDAEPGSLLASQVVRLRQRLLSDSAVVLETEQTGPEGLAWPVRTIARRTLAQVDVLVVRHRQALEASRACGFAGQGVIVDYAVDRAVFHPAEPAAGAVPFHGSGLVVGYVGDLIHESGLIDVLEAVAACRSAVSLSIMGCGPIRAELVDRAASLGISQRVAIIDPAPDGGAAFLNTLDAVVMMLHPAPDTIRRAARTLVSAHACGVPVIVSALVGMQDLVRRGGWIVAQRDAGVLAQLLHHLATSREALACAAAASLEQAERRFSLDVVTHELHRALHVARQNRGKRKLRQMLPETDRLGLQKQLEP